MSTHVAGNTITIWVPLIDSGGAPITDAVDGDFSESIDHEGTDGTLTVATISAWTHRSDGRYKSSITNAVTGTYSGTITYNGTPVQVFGWSATVLPAAADPAAIADALVAVQADVTTVKAMTDVATSTRAIAGAVIASSSPVTSQGSIEIIQGDAYQSADNRALSFSLTSAPDLTGATVTLVISWGVDSVSVTGTVTNAGAATKTVTAQLTSAQTALMPITGTTYQLRATLANTNVVTLKRGRVLVVPPVPAN